MAHMEDGGSFATTKYDTEHGFHDSYAHLTNYSINKKASSYGTSPGYYSSDVADDVL